MSSQDQLSKLSQFAAWCLKHVTGDDKGQVPIFSRFSRTAPTDA